MSTASSFSIFFSSNIGRKGQLGPVPEIIDPVFTKTSQNARFLLSENERFGLVFVKTGSINSGTGILWFYFKIIIWHIVLLIVYRTVGRYWWGDAWAYASQGVMNIWWTYEKRYKSTSTISFTIRLFEPALHAITRRQLNISMTHRVPINTCIVFKHLL
jgi:hypothetical protein